jgi:hypothetical protein
VAEEKQERNFECIRTASSAVAPQAKGESKMPTILKRIPDWLLLIVLGKAVGTIIFL